MHCYRTESTTVDIEAGGDATRRTAKLLVEFALLELGEVLLLVWYSCGECDGSISGAIVINLLCVWVAETTTT